MLTELSTILQAKLLKYQEKRLIHIHSTHTAGVQRLYEFILRSIPIIVILVGKVALGDSGRGDPQTGAPCVGACIVYLLPNIRHSTLELYLPFSRVDYLETSSLSL